MATNGHKYWLIINGVYGRKRKSNLELLPLISFTETEVSDADITTQALDMFESLKPKPGCTWKVQHDLVSREISGGFVIEKGLLTLGSARDIRATGTKS